MFFRSFLLGGLFPSWGGLCCLFLAAILGYIMFGDPGASWVPGVLIVAAFVRPEVHPVLRGILYGARGFCWFFSAVGFILRFNHWFAFQNVLGEAILMFFVGLAAHIRIHFMRRRSIVVNRLGTEF